MFKITSATINSLEEASGAAVDPSLVVGIDVVPSVFELVASGPEEVSGNMVVENLASAVGKILDFRLGEEGRVASALSLLDHGAVAFAPGAKSVSSAVKVNSVLLGEVRVGAVYPFAVKLVLGVRVVETSEPEGADVSCEGPLSNPHGVLDIAEVIED
jgi:hypothetical protein